MNNEENKDLAQHKDEVAKVAPNASNEDVSKENTLENPENSLPEVSVNTENTTENINVPVETVSVEILAETQAEQAHQDAQADTNSEAHKDYSHL